MAQTKKRTPIEMAREKPYHIPYVAGPPADPSKEPRFEDEHSEAAEILQAYCHADADSRRIMRQALQQAVASGAVGRNDTCPCGSTLKYKKCCGN